MPVRLSQWWNAKVDMWFTLAGIATRVNCLQDLKAPYHISVTPYPIVTLTSLSQLENA